MLDPQSLPMNKHASSKVHDYRALLTQKEAGSNLSNTAINRWTREQNILADKAWLDWHAKRAPVG